MKRATLDKAERELRCRAKAGRRPCARSRTRRAPRCGARRSTSSRPSSTSVLHDDPRADLRRRRRSRAAPRPARAAGLEPAHRSCRWARRSISSPTSRRRRSAAWSRGRKASFTIDAFGDHVFHGRIDSFAPGTGSQFALLQPENATGNFTKIVQRVPVKIALEPGDPLIAPAAAGLSAEAVIDVRDEAGARRSRSSRPNQVGSDAVRRPQASFSPLASGRVGGKAPKRGRMRARCIALALKLPVIASRSALIDPTSSGHLLPQAGEGLGPRT